MLNAKFMENAESVYKLDKALRKKYKNGIGEWVSRWESSSTQEMVHYLAHPRDYIHLNFSILNESDEDLCEYVEMMKDFIARTKYSDLTRVRLYIKEEQRIVYSDLVIYTYSSIHDDRITMTEDEQGIFINHLSDSILEHMLLRAENLKRLKIIKTA